MKVSKIYDTPVKQIVIIIICFIVMAGYSHVATVSSFIYNDSFSKAKTNPIVIRQIGSNISITEVFREQLSPSHGGRAIWRIEYEVSDTNRVGTINVRMEKERNEWRYTSFTLYANYEEYNLL